MYSVVNINHMEGIYTVKVFNQNSATFLAINLLIQPYNAKKFIIICEKLDFYRVHCKKIIILEYKDFSDVCLSLLTYLNMHIYSCTQRYT